MQEILKLRPVFKERIWGGSKISDVLGYELPFEKTGECWAISAHPNGDCIVDNGFLAGKTLNNVYQTYPNLFSDWATYDEFPLMTKIIDANANLSVQVHPNNDYAMFYEKSLGKSECWYVLSAREDARIIYGHRAKSIEEFKHMVEDEAWHRLLIERRVKAGDFIYVPAGTLHAIGEGVMVLETQQSSDITYRVYDYDRKDEHGNSRELHLQKALDVINIPHINPDFYQIGGDFGKSKITRLIRSKFFTVELWDVQDKLEFDLLTYKLISVIEGHGTINGMDVKMGEHMIITRHAKTIKANGTMKLILSNV
ncbi:MAG: class I mannose-6-phosphate isomerase [Acholeplasmataceae bacterium]|nr:class I mannose-6-phosphate isomerase [Acholeplasmataceae bacterium]